MTEFPDTQSLLLKNIRSFENREAWDAFVVLYRPVIFRMARRRGLQESDAHDLVQDVLLRVARAIERYSPQDGVRFRHWLRRVITNAILSAISSTPRDEAMGGSDVLDLLHAQPFRIELTGELEYESLRERYLRAATIVKLDVNEETWAAFEMSVLQGLTCDETAKTLGKSIGMIYASRSRVLKRLQTEIQRIQDLEK